MLMKCVGDNIIKTNKHRQSSIMEVARESFAQSEPSFKCGLGRPFVVQFKALGCDFTELEMRVEPT